MAITITVEPTNDGHTGDEHVVHCSDVVPSSEVEMSMKDKCLVPMCPLFGGFTVYRQGVNSLS